MLEYIIFNLDVIARTPIFEFIVLLSITCVGVFIAKAQGKFARSIIWLSKIFTPPLVGACSFAAIAVGISAISDSTTFDDNFGLGMFVAIAFVGFFYALAAHILGTLLILRSIKKTELYTLHVVMTLGAAIGITTMFIAMSSFGATELGLVISVVINPVAGAIMWGSYYLIDTKSPGYTSHITSEKEKE